MEIDNQIEVFPSEIPHQAADLPKGGPDRAISHCQPIDRNYLVYRGTQLGDRCTPVAG
jgi:hypothetical protein